MLLMLILFIIFSLSPRIMYTRSFLSHLLNYHRLFSCGVGLQLDSIWVGVLEKWSWINWGWLVRLYLLDDHSFFGFKFSPCFLHCFFFYLIFFELLSHTFHDTDDEVNPGYAAKNPEDASQTENSGEESPKNDNNDDNGEYKQEEEPLDFAGTSEEEEAGKVEEIGALCSAHLIWEISDQVEDSFNLFFDEVDGSVESLLRLVHNLLGCCMDLWDSIVDSCFGLMDGNLNGAGNGGGGSLHNLTGLTLHVANLLIGLSNSSISSLIDTLSGFTNHLIDKLTYINSSFTCWRYSIWGTWSSIGNSINSCINCIWNSIWNAVEETVWS